MTPGIRTERLALLPYHAGLVCDRHVQWLNDPDIMQYSEQRHIRHTLESVHSYVNEFNSSPHMFMWGIYTSKPNVLIGTITARLDYPNNVANVGILVGEKTEQGKGYGQEAWDGVVDWLLHTRKVRKVEAGCMAGNHAMRKIALKSGMHADGRRTFQFIVNGRAVSLLYYARFRDEGSVVVPIREQHSGNDPKLR